MQGVNQTLQQYSPIILIEVLDSKSENDVSNKPHELLCEMVTKGSLLMTMETYLVIHIIRDVKTIFKKEIDSIKTRNLVTKVFCFLENRQHLILKSCAIFPTNQQQLPFLPYRQKMQKSILIPILNSESLSL